MKNTKNAFFSVLLASAFVFAGKAQAQISYLTPHNMGMGGGGTAYVSDFHALYVNPANMLLNPRRTTVSVGVLPTIGIQIGGPFIGIGDYNEYFTKGGTMDAATTEAFLTRVFGTDESALISANTNLDIVPFGTSVRFGKMAIGLGTRARVISTVGLSRGFTQLALRGFDYESFDTPRGVDMTMSVAQVAEVSMGFAFELMSFENTNPFLNGRLLLGVSPKYVMSNAYSRVNLDSDLRIYNSGNFIDSMAHNFNLQVETIGEVADKFREYNAARNSPNGSDVRLIDALTTVDPVSFTQPAASTVGLDIGLTYEANLENMGFLQSKRKYFRLSVSVTDIGKLDYADKGKGGRFASQGRFVWKGLDADRERIEQEFEDFGDYASWVFEDSVGRGIYGAFSEDLYSPTINLPTAVNVGTYLAIGRFGLALDYSQGMYALGNNVAEPVLAAGAEWRVFDRWLPITFRGGIRMGGITPQAYSFGTGLSFRNIDLTFSTMAFSGDQGDGMYFGTALTGLMVRF
jgi:hypothetical protein